MVALLHDEGFHTLEAHSGEAALEIAHREQPELVLLDVVLPDLNGREVCQRIKSAPDLRNTFVILISGHEVSCENRVRGLEVGADEYLSKPVQLAELVARIRSFIRIHDSGQALRQVNEDLELRVGERTSELTAAVDDLRREVSVRENAEQKLQVYTDELRKLSRKLIETQEQERRRIARELHDEAGQAMTVLKFVFSEIEGILPEEGLRRLEDGQEALERMVHLIRNLYQEVRPSILDDLGLLPALLWHIDRFKINTKVRVDFEHDGIDGRRFEPDLETAAYRVTQESLTNIARHARVEDARVHVWTDDERLHLQIQDFGQGFDLDRPTKDQDSCGLIGMGERVQLLGGEFSILSQPGRGTRINAGFPLQVT